MAKKHTSTLSDSNTNPPLPNVELLTQIASQTGHGYADAYTVWLEYHSSPDAYGIVDTVLWIAQIQNISVVDALNVVQEIDEQFGSSFDTE